MKQKLYIVGLADVIVILSGAILKINHFPGAAILMTIGLSFFILFFLPCSLVNSYRSENTRNNLILYFVTGLTCVVVFTAMLFKLMHWPYAGLGLLIALPFPYVVFLPVYLYVTSRRSEHNIYNTVFVLFLLALNSVSSALLGLGVTQERISDSLKIIPGYNRIEVSSVQPSSAVGVKADELISLIENYREVILKDQDVTKDQWSKDPMILRTLNSRSATMAALSAVPGFDEKKLWTGLNELISIVRSSGADENSISSLEKAFGIDINNFSNSDVRNALYDFQSWSLVYLEGLEANLKLLKLSM